MGTTKSFSNLQVFLVALAVFVVLVITLLRDAEIRLDIRPKQ